jgi:hypothetical protein
MASAAVNGLKHLWPVGVAETIRSDLLPLMSEIAVLAIRLSMTGDTEIKDAAVKISDAVGALAGSLVAKEKEYLRLESEMNAALGELRRARDAAAARRWYRPRHPA